MAVFGRRQGPARLCCRRAGECPEWQRELTVNQPPHGFAGSSPASPTKFISFTKITRTDNPGQAPEMGGGPRGAASAGVVDEQPFCSLCTIGGEHGRTTTRRLALTDAA